MAVEWDAEIINEVEDKLIAWRSLPGADVVTGGSVNFDAARGGRSTQLTVHLQYAPPAGNAGAFVACSPGGNLHRRSAKISPTSNKFSKPAKFLARRSARQEYTMRAVRCYGKETSTSRTFPIRRSSTRTTRSSRSRRRRSAAPTCTSTTATSRRCRRATCSATSSWARWSRSARKQALKVGDRVVVPFTIACGRCWFCKEQLWSLCDNTNPNAWMAEKVYGYAGSGLFGYSHMYGGYPGGQAEYARVPFADVGPLKVPDTLTDEQVLFLSDIFPTGYMAAENCQIKPGDTVAVWGCGPVGQFAIKSAFLLGAERVIAIDASPSGSSSPPRRAGRRR